MNFIGNLIWLIFGGFIAAMGYFVGGLILCLTIVGIPFGLQCFKLTGLALFPFGRQVVNKATPDGCLTTVCNLIWLVCGGWYTALIHLFFGLLLYISIIGIPFGRQHFKLLMVSMMPFGKDIV